jgi:drug/metabolite transporter (DMT)-like permease
MQLRDTLLLVLLAALWGASYLFMRIAGPVLGSVPLMGLRVAIAGAALLAFAAATRQVPDVRARWRQFLFLGLIGNAIPFVLIANSVMDLNASLGAILNATTPMCAAIIAAVWIRDSFGPRKLLGCLLGIGGVAVLVGWSPLPITPRTLWAVAEAQLASFSYGLTVVYARTRFQTLPPLHTAVGQLCGATLLLFAPTLALWPNRPISWGVALAVLTLALACSAVAYLIYFHLIKSVGPLRTTTVTFLVPFFSILWGGLFLHEPLTPGIVVGLGVILFSVWLVLTGR